MARIDPTPEQKQEAQTAAAAKATAENRHDLGRPMYWHAISQFSIDQSRTPTEWVQLAYTRLIQREAYEARKEALEVQGRRLVNTLLDAKVSQGHDRADIEPFITAVFAAWREAGALERADLVGMLEDAVQAL